MTNPETEDEDVMQAPDPRLGELLIAAARARMEQKALGIREPVFRFDEKEDRPANTEGKAP